MLNFSPRLLLLRFRTTTAGKGVICSLFFLKAALATASPEEDFVLQEIRYADQTALKSWSNSSNLNATIFTG